MRNGGKRAFARWFSVVTAIILLFSYGGTGLGNANAKSNPDGSQHVLALKNYSKDVKLNGGLNQFIGIPGEIGYDDGTSEGGSALKEAGSAWGVRMSLPEGKEKALVTGGKFLFSDHFPNPDDTAFQVEVWDASGKEGAPGKKLAGPIDATALRNGEWTIVDLKDKGIVVDEDFYIVFVSQEAYPNGPGLEQDKSSPFSGRNWERYHGTWYPLEASIINGNKMIRALVSYELIPPVITSPDNHTVTDQEKITVTGKADSAADVTILDNGKEVATTSPKDDGTFSVDLTLEKGENELTATASTDAGTTEPSDPVTVILDQDKPDLTIDTPKDRLKTNNMAVNVKGKASDENLDSVKVNGVKADLGDNGSFSQRLLLDEGENNINVVAEDKAGNKEKKSVKVFAKFEAPEITNLKPSEDKHLQAGESVIIEMDAEPGLDATFAIHLPLAQTQRVKASSTDELPMKEISEGHYRGVWTATGLTAKGATIEVIIRDDYGNKTKEKAGGELFINTSNHKPGKTNQR